MQVTAREVTDRALRLLRLYGAGETISADDSDTALNALNDMLDGWSTNKQFILASTIETFPLTAGQSTYTIGAGQDFDTTRPLRVLDASFVRLNDVDYQLTNITEEQYAGIAYKPSSGIPQWVYYDPTVPDGSISLFWVPYSGMTLHLYSWKALTEFPDLDTVVEMGEGYKRALSYSLAEEVASEFDVDVPQQVARIAATARKQVKRLNHVPPVLKLNLGHRGPYSVGYWRI